MSMSKREPSYYDRRNFELNHPGIEDHICECWETPDHKIIAVLDDDSAVEYDLILNISRHAMNLDILTRKRNPSNEEEWRKYFSRKLYRMMRSRAYNQFDLSELTGISQASITKYVNGYATPTAYKLVLIAKALRCSVDELVDV